ncbi:MAG: polyprenyl synthetase family protein [Gammaproteobacteria bacterium]|nr:polyprenyl synthetase family protein [Gammaproteobacteria bacterium]
MHIREIQDLLTEDMQSVNETIRQSLKSNVHLIGQLAGHIINSGGKRMRPQLVLLSAKAAGYTGRRHINIAAIIEFIHTSTLLHDDVVDRSDLRRGQETANHIWGNEAAVLVGDFLYSRSFQMMVAVNDMRIMNIMAETTNTIAEGEVLQLLNVHDPDTSEAMYYQVIQHKTAALFESATRLGGVLAQAGETVENALAQYGLSLGVAFQLADDVLDYSASSADIGKEIGDDLAEGKPTLPLILAMQQGSKTQADCIRNAIKTGGLEQLENVIDIVHATGALDATMNAAQSHADTAIAALSSVADSPFKTALTSLARYAVAREK